MYKLILSFSFALVLSVGISSAQTIQEAKKLLLQERYQAAKITMEKVVSAGPTNPESIYWLVQVLLEMKDISGCQCCSVEKG
jgi:TolA-binding protein